MKKNLVVSILLMFLLVVAFPMQQASAANTTKDAAKESDLTLTELLKEVYANEQDLDSYKFESSVNFGLEFPEMGEEDPELAMIFDVLKDIQIDIDGAFKKDPMVFEANIDVTLKGDIQTTFTIPMVMTQEKMWFKLPESPLLPLPKEVKGKFIEFDFAQLAELTEEPLTEIDYELETKLASEMINLVIDALGKDFYKEVDPATVTIPEGVEADKVIKFELTNETLKPFFNKAINEIFPKFVELVGQPEYLEYIGIPAEEVALLKEAMATEEITEEMINELVTELKKYFTINQFDEILVITKDNYIGSDEATIDFTVKLDEEQEFTFKMTFIQTKSEVNKEFDLNIGIPTKENVLPFEKLIEMEEALY